MRIAKSNAMMEITTKSSISVKAFRFVITALPPSSPNELSAISYIHDLIPYLDFCFHQITKSIAQFQVFSSSPAEIIVINPAKT